MHTPIRTFAVIIVLVLATAVGSSAMRVEEAREDIAWRADLKGLSETDKARIVDSFDRLREFVTVREARDLCLESVRHTRPPAPEQRIPASAASAGKVTAEEGQALSDPGNGDHQAAGKTYQETRKNNGRKLAGKTARRSVKSSARSDGKLDHELLGLERPLFPSIFSETQ